MLLNCYWHFMLTYFSLRLVFVMLLTWCWHITIKLLSGNWHISFMLLSFQSRCCLLFLTFLSCCSNTCIYIMLLTGYCHVALFSIMLLTCLFVFQSYYSYKDSMLHNKYTAESNRARNRRETGSGCTIGAENTCILYMRSDPTLFNKFKADLGGVRSRS